MEHTAEHDASRMTRRAQLRRGAAVAGALAFGSALAACAGPRGPRVRPTPTVPPTRLVVDLSYQGAGSYGGVIQDLVDSYIAQNFSARHRGVEVRTVPAPRPSVAGTQGAPAVSTLDASGVPTDIGAQLAAIIAGNGADVLTGTGYAFAAFVDNAMLAPLDPVVRAAGLDLSVFDPGHIAILRQPSGGLYGLPAFDGPAVVLCNLTRVLARGLALPGPDWTSVEAAALWRELSGQSGGRHLWGMALDLQDYFLHLFGGELMSADGTRCLLDQPLVVEAANWVVPLYQQGVCDVTATGAGADVRGGSAAFGMTAGHSLQADLLALEGQGIAWDFLPMPLFPGGRRSTYNNGDWYGINARSKQPADLLGELLSFIATDAGLARLLFRTTFVPPNQRTLWADWLASVRAAAPVLQSKHIEYFVEAMEYGYCNHRFRYQPYVCDQILERWIIRIFLGTVSPALGLERATQEINALQAPA